MNDKKVTIPFPLPRLLTPCSMIKRWKKLCLLGLISDQDGQDQKVGYRINCIISEVLVSRFFSFFKHCTEHWTRYSQTKNCSLKPNVPYCQLFTICWYCKYNIGDQFVLDLAQDPPKMWESRKHGIFFVIYHTLMQLYHSRPHFWLQTIIILKIDSH